MADRFTIEPGVYCWFTRARSGDRIDIEAKVVSGSDPRPVDAKELSGVKSLLVGWEKNAVVQRKLDTGCIPTGYEYLLRSAGVEGIDYAKFQDELRPRRRRRTTTRPSRAPSPASTRTCASLV